MNRLWSWTRGLGLALAVMLAAPGPTAVGQPSLDAFCRAHVDRLEAKVLAAQTAVCSTTLINHLTNTMWTQLYGCMQNGQQHAGEVEAEIDAQIAQCQGPPRAPDHCDDYAERSIVQIHRGLELGCNFSGPDWSTRDAPTLIAQCRAGARTGDIVNLRDQQLSNCERKPNEDKCEAFADSAILQSVKDREMQCGLAGRDRWATEGRSELVAWCRQASEGAARSYLEARDGDLGSCRYRGPDVCETFASTVEAQGARDVEMRCGLAGRPEWAMASRGELLSWCRAKPKAEVDGYVLMRERALDNCRAHGPDKCVAFADAAQAQTQAALQMRCPFAGRQHWIIMDKAGLRSWCAASQGGLADRYLALRDQDLRTCKMTGR